MAFLELDNLHKAFGTSAAVESISLQVERGEFISLLGPSGCGKTTTLRMVAGFERPTSGAIRLGDVEITSRPPNQRNIGMVFQSYALFPHMTVSDNIAFGLTIAHKPAADVKQRVDEMLSIIKMGELSNRYPYQLSGGQQQRVALARALAIRPQVLLLDEPLSALDAKIRQSLRAEIRAIQRQLGITTLYVTHDQEEAMSLSDRIVVMNQGHVEQVGTPFDIYNFPRTAFTASFVGTLNVIPTTVIDPQAGVLSIDGLNIAAPAAPNAQPGQRLSIALRPEIISLNGNSMPGDANHLTGIVENITFLGSIVRVQVRLGRQLVLVDEFNRPDLHVPQVGQPIKVSFPRAACLLLEVR